MSVNILDLVKGAVSDQVMGQLGGLLGTDAKKTPSLFETASGAILGGLMKKGSTSQGAKDIFGAVEKHDDSVLDKLGDLLGGGDSTDEFQRQGSGILDMVLGGSQQSSGMIETIAKSLGLDKGVVGKLLMMAAPIIMGVIGKHIKNAALDAVGLGKLLGDQKSHLASAMPASLTKDLGFGNLLGQAGDMAGSATDAVGNAAGAAMNTAGNAAGAASNAGGGLLKFLIPLGIIGALAVWGIPKIMNINSLEGPPNDESQVMAAGSSDIGLNFSSIPGIDELGDTGIKLTADFTNLTKGLKDVSDEAGAKALAEKFTGFTGSIDGLGLDKLEGAGKTTVSGMVAEFVKVVKELLAGKSDGIQGILKPVVNALMEKLSSFSA